MDEILSVGEMLMHVLLSRPELSSLGIVELVFRLGGDYVDARRPISTEHSTVIATGDGKAWLEYIHSNVDGFPSKVQERLAGSLNSFSAGCQTFLTYQVCESRETAELREHLHLPKDPKHYLETDWKMMITLTRI